MISQQAILPTNPPPQPHIRLLNCHTTVHGNLLFYSDGQGGSVCLSTFSLISFLSYFSHPHEQTVALHCVLGCFSLLATGIGIFLLVSSSLSSSKKSLFRFFFFLSTKCRQGPLNKRRSSKRFRAAPKILSGYSNHSRLTPGMLKTQLLLSPLSWVPQQSPRGTEGLEDS